MKKRRDRTQEHLDKLREVRANPAAGVAALREALASPSNYVAAKAAEIVEQSLLGELTPDLVAAFTRFLADAPVIDKGCAATTAIVKALYALDYADAGVYRKGIRHRQMEGMGGASDVATELRGASALGLSQTNDPQALDELVRLLTDAEAPARLIAARAIGCRNDAASSAVLLFKLHTGDPELEVLAECMAGMLAIELSDRTLALVMEQLDSTDAERAEAAAIALGSVRDERGFEALRAKWDATAFGELRERLLHAMAMSRTEKAIGFLLELAAEAPLRTAEMAVKSLAMHRRDARIADLVVAAGARRLELQSVIRAAFNRSTLE